MELCYQCNDLVPDSGEISATRHEVDDSAHVKEALDRFMGIDSGDHVRIHR